MRFPLLLLLVVLGSLALNAQNGLEKGVVIDSIAVSKTANETFALYLPESFVESEPQPILFIYEPLGRGAVGIQPFMSASEKYGLILVCSNNSKNGPYDRNFAISNNLFNHVFSNFNINEDEMFVSGFSGGSRLAAAIASLTNKFMGVIGCGAGFSGLQEHMPATQNYSYVGLCGNQDMNYSEMLENRDYLNLIRFNSTLITFDGNHSWPPAEQIVRAFDWLYLQRAKRNPSDPKSKISSFFKVDHNRLQQFLENNALLFADEQYARMIQDYKDVLSIDSLETKYTLFKKSKPVKKRQAALENALKIETKLFDKFRTRFSNEFDKPGDPDFGWWKKEIDKLDTLEEKEDEELQKMVGRVKFGLFAMAFERKMVLPKTADQKQVSSLESLIQLIHPK